MIVPFKQNELLKNDILEANKKDNRLRIWWLGQSGFLIQWNSFHVLFDPYLSNSLTEKYANTDKPHVRLSERVIDPSILDMIDVVTSSHNHTDHLDYFTLKPIFEANPKVKFLIPEANRSFVAERCKIDESQPIGLVSGETYVFNPNIRISAIPAAHNDLKTDNEGRHHFLGYILKIGTYTIYHSGDTLWYEGLEDTLKQYNPEIAFLPINGNKPERRVAGNLNCEEAAELGKRIGATVIPHHYDMFEFNTEDPAKFERECLGKGTKYHILKLGEQLEFSTF